MEDKIRIYTVRVERTTTQARDMTVLGTSEEDAEENAKAAVNFFCSCAVLQDSEWDAGDEWDEFDVNEVEDLDDEFGSETADEFRQKIALHTAGAADHELVNLEKLFAAGWKVDVGAGGPFGKGKVRVRVYPEGEKIGTFGFGDTVELAVRDAAKINEALTAALAA